MSKIGLELLSQPACWRTAAALVAGAEQQGTAAEKQGTGSEQQGAADRIAGLLPPSGARVALAGCGTSLYMAQAIAAWRESQGEGETDAFAASEMPVHRRYDRVIVISRSGTTTEVVRLIEQLRPVNRVLAITAVPGSPVAEAATETIELAFADEASVVQTRFATTVCALWRAYLGHDVTALSDAAQAQLAALTSADGGAEEVARARQFVFLGHGAGAALANEAALKFREAALAWSEAYPAMEFRHGPISVAGEHSLVWAIGELNRDLAAQVTATGASIRQSAGDPLVDLVSVHYAAVRLAAAKGLDPDAPRHLTRSVVLR